eukprot:188861-Chlamydomonas_euryale.AAC.1
MAARRSVIVGWRLCDVLVRTSGSAWQGDRRAGSVQLQRCSPPLGPPCCALVLAVLCFAASPFRCGVEGGDQLLAVLGP